MWLTAALAVFAGSSVQTVHVCYVMQWLCVCLQQPGKMSLLARDLWLLARAKANAMVRTIWL